MIGGAAPGVAVLGAAVLAYAVLLLGRPLPAGVTGAVDDLGQLAAAALATACCAGASGRASVRRVRWAWRILAAGTGCWAAGEAVWSYYELLADRPVPFPSPADAGFLGFPVLAAAALLILPGGADSTAAVRGRNLLDGLIIAGSLLVLASSTSLGAALDAGGSTRLAAAIGLAYPLGDVLVLTLVLLVIGRVTGRRLVLALVAAGLSAVGMSDSAFVALTSSGSYTTGGICDLGWVAGFTLIGAAGLLARIPSPASGTDATPVPSWLRLALPYLPLLAAETVVAGQLLTGRSPVPVPEIALSFALMVAVLGRQFLTLADNRRLLTALRAERELARHQALHDPLTGLPNRTLFLDRVQHALALRGRGGAPVTVLFCDVDDFKTVNDDLGHAAGDALLQAVAGRLLACLRPADTVARLGGDEFAVLIERRVETPDQLGARLVAALAEPVPLPAAAISVTVSIGLAHTEPHDDIDPAELLRRADTAMYTAKARGKATWTTHPAAPAPALAAAP